MAQPVAIPVDSERPLPAGLSSVRGAARLRAVRITAAAVSVAAITVLAAVVRFAGIGHQSYWYDEAHTVWLIHFSLPEMVSRLNQTETSPPLYFLIAWLWAHLFGYGAATLRALSALAGIATVPLAYTIGVKLITRRAGLVVAALAACNPLLVWYSQEARSYAFLVLLTGVALLAFLHLRERPSRRWAVVWGGAAVLALATHYYAALAIGPEAVWLAARMRRVRCVRFAIEAVLVFAAALVPLLIAQMGFLASNNWIKDIPLAWRIAEVPQTFVIGPGAPAATLLLAISAATVFGSAALLIFRGGSAERRAASLLAGLTAAGIAIVIGLIVLGHDQLDYRNMLPLWLPLALIVAAGISSRRAGLAGAVATLALCAVGLAGVISVAVDQRLQRPDWQAVARVVGAGPQRAIFMINGCQLLPLSVYVHGLQLTPTARVRELDLISAGRETSWSQVLMSDWYVTCVPSKGVVVPNRLGPFHATGIPLHAGQFTITRLRAARPSIVGLSMLAGAGLRGELMVKRPDRSSGPTNGYQPPQT